MVKFLASCTNRRSGMPAAFILGVEGTTRAPVVRPTSCWIEPRYDTFGDVHASHATEWLESRASGGQADVGATGSWAAAVDANAHTARMAAVAAIRDLMSPPNEPKSGNWREQPAPPRVPRNVRVLSAVSFFQDAASE